MRIQELMMKLLLALLLCLSITSTQAAPHCKSERIKLMVKVDQSQVLDGKTLKKVEKYPLPGSWSMKMGFYDQIYIEKDTKDLTIRATSVFKGKKIAEVKAKASEFTYFHSLIGKATQWPATITFTVLLGKKELCQQQMKIEGFSLKKI